MEKSWDLYPSFHRNKCCYGMHLVDDDHISSLPDELLLLILSFLPLKEMVKRSILSKRWLNLWVNTPVLDFYLNTVGFSSCLCQYFVGWVDDVLQQHKSPHLKEFRISYNFTNDHREDIDRWLEFALARKVEILEFNFLLSTEFLANARNYVFPNSWFITSSGKADADGAKSRVLHFKFLRSLILKNVHIAGETIDFFLKNCPFIERLEIVGSHIMVNLVISDPTLMLKHLKVKQCRGLNVLSISNFNLVSLDTSVGDLILNDLPMLVELSIYGYVNNLNRIVSQNATCLLQLKHLELSAFNLKEVTEMVLILTQLTELKRLVIHFVASDDERLIVLLNVIKSCNSLEEFVLELQWLGPKRWPRALKKVERLGFENLKLFEFKGYYGRASDLELMINLVKNAPRLEKIIIDGYDMLKRLLNYPVDDIEKEARRYALKHIYGLKKAKILPQHVGVLMR